MPTDYKARLDKIAGLCKDHHSIGSGALPAMAAVSIARELLADNESDTKTIHSLADELADLRNYSHEVDEENVKLRADNESLRKLYVDLLGVSDSIGVRLETLEAERDKYKADCFKLADKLSAAILSESMTNAP
ncbi:MAG: hypothetical protein V3W44_10970 [Dehalococcoidales bacterium]